MSATAVSRYVTRNPEILSGEPIIIGTRTSTVYCRFVAIRHYARRNFEPLAPSNLSSSF